MNKPETAFTKLFISKLDPFIYVEKTNNPFRKGMPDLYVEGHDIMWIEVKHILEPWTQSKNSSKICSTASWTHQRHWLERAHSKGRKTKVIVGVGSGKKTKAYILDYPYSFDPKENELYTIEQVAEIIQQELITCNLITQEQTSETKIPSKLVLPQYN